MFNYLFRIYKKANVLSLDIVLGALLSAAFANAVFAYQAEWWYYMILASSVWLVYTMDHIVDSLKNKEKTTSKRHLFYFVNLKSIIVFVALISLLVANLIFFFAPLSLVFFGIFVGSVSLVYLVVLLKKPNFWLPKELLVALIYTLGIWGFPIVLYHSIGLEDLIFPFIFFLLVLFVLLFYSVVDLEEDIANGFLGILSVLPKSSAERLLIMILTFEIIGFLFLQYFFLWNEILPFSLIYFVMISMNFALYFYRNRLKSNGVYRIVGESIFFVPGIVIGIMEMCNFAKNIL